MHISICKLQNVMSLKDYEIDLALEKEFVKFISNYCNSYIWQIICGKRCYYTLQNEYFPGYIGTSLSVSGSICVQNTSFCQGGGGGGGGCIKSHLSTAVVVFKDST